MTPRLFKLTTLLLALAAPAWSLLPATAQAGERGPRQSAAATTVAEDASQARVIVKYKSGSTLMRAQAASGSSRPQHAATLSTRLGLPLTDGPVLGSQTQALRGSGLSSSQLVAKLTAQSDVEWAVVDGRKRATAVPNDPYYAAGQTSITPTVGQWYLRAYDSTIVSAINAVGAWSTTTGSSSVTVAVLDTGVLFDHPDLSGKLYAGYDFIADTDTANDGGGRDADATDPGDWVTSTENTTRGGSFEGCGASDSSWHGTQVSGLIGAATDNSLGMASVGRNVMILPVRVLGKCGGYDSDIIAAMRWAGGLSSDPVSNPHPAQVINMSLGSSGSCSAAYTAVFSELTAAGVTVVVAAGNDAGLAVSTPANCTGAIAVAGVRHVGTKVGYSSVGSQVAISAPAGNCVNTGDSDPCLYPLLTTTNLGTTTVGTYSYSDSYNYSVGTSFATPLVAGTAALMLSVNSSLTPAQIKSALQSSARTFPTSGGTDSSVTTCHAPTSTEQYECYCTTSTCGAGMLDASAAVAAVAPTLTAAISVSNSTPTAGASVTLDGSGSTVTGGRTITGYAWAITAGSSLASFSGSTTGSSAALVTSGAGTVTVQLTVTDSSGATASTSSTITVSAASSSSSGSSGDSGGGGALGWGWLLGLGAALGLLRRR